MSVPQITGDLETKIQGLDQIISTHAGTVLSIQTLPTAIEEEDEASKMYYFHWNSHINISFSVCWIWWQQIRQLKIWTYLLKIFSMLENLIWIVISRYFIEIAMGINLLYFKVYKDNTEREFLNNVIMKKLITEQQQQF